MNRCRAGKKKGSEDQDGDEEAQAGCCACCGLSKSKKGKNNETEEPPKVLVQNERQQAPIGRRGRGLPERKQNKYPPVKESTRDPKRQNLSHDKEDLEKDRERDSSPEPGCCACCRRKRKPKKESAEKKEDESPERRTKHVPKKHSGNSKAVIVMPYKKPDRKGQKPERQPEPACEPEVAEDKDENTGCFACCRRKVKKNKRQGQGEDEEANTGCCACYGSRKQPKTETAEANKNQTPPRQQNQDTKPGPSKALNVVHYKERDRKEHTPNRHHEPTTEQVVNEVQDDKTSCFACCRRKPKSDKSSEPRQENDEDETAKTGCCACYGARRQPKKESAEKHEAQTQELGIKHDPKPLPVRSNGINIASYKEHDRKEHKPAQQDETTTELQGEIDEGEKPGCCPCCIRKKKKKGQPNRQSPDPVQENVLKDVIEQEQPSTSQTRESKEHIPEPNQDDHINECVNEHEFKEDDSETTGCCPCRRRKKKQDKKQSSSQSLEQVREEELHDENIEEISVRTDELKDENKEEQPNRLEQRHEHEGEEEVKPGCCPCYRRRKKRKIEITDTREDDKMQGPKQETENQIQDRQERETSQSTSFSVASFKEYDIQIIDSNHIPTNEQTVIEDDSEKPGCCPCCRGKRKRKRQQSARPSPEPSPEHEPNDQNNEDHISSYRTESPKVDEMISYKSEKTDITLKQSTGSILRPESEGRKRRSQDSTYDDNWSEPKEEQSEQGELDPPIKRAKTNDEDEIELGSVHEVEEERADMETRETPSPKTEKRRKPANKVYPKYLDISNQKIYRPIKQVKRPNLWIPHSHNIRYANQSTL